LIITIECYVRNKIKEEEGSGARVTYGKVRNYYKILFGKPYLKVYLGDQWLILKLILKHVECMFVVWQSFVQNCIDLA